MFNTVLLLISRHEGDRRCCYINDRSKTGAEPVINITFEFSCQPPFSDKRGKVKILKL